MHDVIVKYVNNITTGINICLSANWGQLGQVVI